MTACIGILGGMGPRATVQFEQLLLDALEGSDQQLPTIVSINDGGIPDRSSFVLGIGQDPVPRMQYNLTQLEQLGAKIVCVPCNTACVPAIFNRLQSAADVTVINLPQEVVRLLSDVSPRQVYVLATAGTVASGAYQDACTAASIAYVVPDAATHRLLATCITLVKQNKLALARKIALQVAAAVRETDSDAVILGCTELPLVADALVPSDSQAIDTLQVLVDTCVQYIKRGEVHDTRPIYA